MCVHSPHLLFTFLSAENGPECYNISKTVEELRFRLCTASHKVLESAPESMLSVNLHDVHDLHWVSSNSGWEPRI